MIKQKKIIFIFTISLVFMLVFCSQLVISQSAYGPEIHKETYIISRSKVEREITQGNLFTDNIKITNLRETNLEVNFIASESISEIIEFETRGIIIEPKNSTQANFLIKGKEAGNYSGIIELEQLNEQIPVNISIVDESLNPEILFEIKLLKNKYNMNKFLEFNSNINKLKPSTIYNASISYTLISPQNQTYLLGKETVDITNSYQVYKKFAFPENIEEGHNVLESVLEYNKKVIIIKSSFEAKKPFYSVLILGVIPVWMVMLIIGLGILSFLSYHIIKKQIEKKKKYRMKLDAKTLPKKNPDFFYLGKVAETKIPMYLEPGRLMTHSIVAGATGGGKSITAQVIVEEALLKNIAVVVFDPTAQWSGLLRKCTDKKMFAYYPKFGMKEQDARGFKGNIRQVKDARQVIDINKHIHPGQIQIFTLNRLDPKDIDIFIANVIRQIFRSDPKESPELKVLLVFDEVHRLLSKFGGSGEGFLQIERGCREFRKWGMGIMLVSQVLSDFVGEIKANISTEVQMRTRDEGDLGRIQTKYGEDFLQSLVKASVGVGMFVNPAYNHASPFFINFRPILHNTRRLPDEELDKYNNYNDVIDDIEYQIEQLEQEKIDTFDLKMELKLVKDKLMTGNFAIVDIYLEGLKPRLEQQWNKLGKKPKKKKIELVAEEEIKKSIEEAKKARKEFEKEEKDKEEKTEKKPEKKEDVKEKQIKALTFDNGIMVSSVNELIGVLPNLDEEIFKLHINKEKNDIASWLKQLSPELESKFKNITDKSKMTEQLKNIDKLIGKSGEGKKDKGKGKSKEKQEEKEQDKTKKQDKKQETQKTTKKASKKQAKTKSKKTKSDKKTKKK